MTKQLKIKIIGMLSIALIIGSCTKKFEEFNTNPNQPTAVPLSNHFGGVLVNFNQSYMVSGGQDPNYVGSRLGAGMNTYSSIGEEWSAYYEALKNITKIIKDAEEQGNTNMQAAALTLRAQMTQVLTDRYRDMPYFDAVTLVDGDLTPEYDTQEEIYPAIIADLKAAADLFKAGTTGDMGPGDILNGGDMDKWRKYCNSLRLRVAIRLSNIDMATSQTIIDEVLGNEVDYPVLESNSDNVEMFWPGTSPWDHGLWYWWQIYHHEGPGKLIVDHLNDFNDPRRAIWFLPAETDGEYRGSERVGFSPEFVREDISDFNPVFVNGTVGPDGYFRYAEICFLKAEIYKRGILTGDAEAEYYKGIEASMLQYGVDPGLITPYFGEPGVSWEENSDDLNKIYIQKYISLFLMDNEGKSEAMRTDVPVLPVALGSIFTGHNRAPFRLPYPQSEQSLNSVNVKPFLQNVVDFYWGQQMWWDTRTGVQ